MSAVPDSSPKVKEQLSGKFLTENTPPQSSRKHDDLHTAAHASSSSRRFETISTTQSESRSSQVQRDSRVEMDGRRGCTVDTAACAESPRDTHGLHCLPFR